MKIAIGSDHAGLELKNHINGYLEAIILVVVAVVIRIVMLFLTIKKVSTYVSIAAFIVLSFGFAYYLQGSAFSSIDYIFNILMWGDPTQFPYIIIFGIIFLVGIVANIVSFFLEKDA